MMRNRQLRIAMPVSCVALMLIAGAFVFADDASPSTSSSEGQVFEGMGSHHFAITTDSSEAQIMFDQGLIWSYGFNHAEAIRSFKRTAELDSACAMAWWGVALCASPQYNHPDMTDNRIATGWDAIQKAQARIDNTSPMERALIEALALRYADPAPEDWTTLNEAYANAMAKVHAIYPNNSDVGTLYAEAMMVLKPWKLYSVDGVPEEGTAFIIELLDHVIALDPSNPGANHLYIHAVEPSSTPYRGLDAARRLNDAVPIAGHLLHMPSHIYVRTGHWDEAVSQNEKAIRADKNYRDISTNPLQQYSYQIHNAHMKAYAAMMDGREREAMAAARTMWEIYPGDLPDYVKVYVDRWMCSVYDVQKRFGRWDAIIAEPAPPSDLPITLATWHANRAVAYAAKKDFKNAEREYEAFRKAKANLPDDHRWGRGIAHRVLEVGDYFIAGEIALQRGDWAAAANLLIKSAAVEDTLRYGEPPQYLQPVRHTLGAVYLIAGKFQDAERTYREDLAKWPNNGWSLFGLSRALRGQGKDVEAEKVEAHYQREWADADEMTTTSCKCIPKT